MTEPRTLVHVLRLAVILTALFNVLALLVLVRGTPILFTVYMFLGQPLFVVAVILLLGAVVADLRAKQLF
jgi:hypothetical protein